METNKPGFTLIELIVVIGLIGVLVAVFLVAMNPVTQMRKSRDTRRKSDLNQTKTSLAIYRNVFEDYPDDDGTGGIVGCDCASPPCACVWGQRWVRKGVEYMKVLPDDPLSGQDYFYDYLGQDSFRLIANLEIDTDPDTAESQARCSFGSGSQYVVCDD